MHKHPVLFTQKQFYTEKQEKETSVITSRRYIPMTITQEGVACSDRRQNTTRVRQFGILTHPLRLD